MRIALKFAYDGKPFYGYARQPNLKTIEGELLSILISHGIINDAKTSQFRSASRTDKGVSALGNVVAFNTDCAKNTIVNELNKDLSDIVVYAIADAGSDFYPRYAKQRLYRYYMKKRGMDLDSIISSAATFTGDHDFSNFARVEEFKDPIRTIDNIFVMEKDDFFVIDFYAQTFLWHQIRRIISSLEKVGKGKLEREDIIEALDFPDKKVDFGIAPAEPLVLKDIVYNFSFEYDKNHLKALDDLETRIVNFICNEI